MECLSNKSSTPVKNTEENAEETRQKQKITDGYPVMLTPFVPEIMKHAIVQKKIINGGHPSFGLTFSSEKSNLVNIESLEMIRNKLLEIFVNFPEVMKELEKPIPRNTIAVSFSEFNFQVGNSCQDFLPIDKFKVPDGAFYTYQKLSENLQATFYNENGTQFLAGLCYYPAPNGKRSYLENDDALVNLVKESAELFPLQDREKMHKKVNYNRYGRYCGTAGKRVWVDCSGRHGIIRHVEYDHFLNEWAYTPCDECLKDAFTYKWAEPNKQWRKNVGRIFSSLKDAFTCKVETPKKKGSKPTTSSTPSKSIESEKKREA